MMDMTTFTSSPLDEESQRAELGLSPIPDDDEDDSTHYRDKPPRYITIFLFLVVLSAVIIFVSNDILYGPSSVQQISPPSGQESDPGQRRLDVDLMTLLVGGSNSGGSALADLGDTPAAAHPTSEEYEYAPIIDEESPTLIVEGGAITTDSNPSIDPESFNLPDENELVIDLLKESIAKYTIALERNRALQAAMNCGDDFHC
mmetsp:Transcript_32831/g.69057  ORF Transcript_32831/g.69057 Transcript_32831/m.69057 type:complete len:202 (+) Transcript_32831:146-751(+)